jgi:predicted fused transcriptional regulator/phosphomethylpyrimidine kinase
MRGRVNVPANPEFGASHHVATTVLAARSADSTIRGAVNLATSNELLAAVPDDMDAVAFDAGYEDRRRRLDTLFADGIPDVLYHEGAFGVEPVTYVLGTGAVDAVERAIRVVDRADDRDRASRRP